MALASVSPREPAVAARARGRRARGDWLHHVTRQLRDFISRFVSGSHAVALADQAVVSGTSFFTTVMIARWADATQLGTYAIGISLLASVIAAQDALIVRPYSIQRYQRSGSAAEHAGASLALSMLLSAGCIIVLALALLRLSGGHADPSLILTGWALAGAIPFALAREFSRQFAFAHLNVAHALVLDGTVAAFQLSIVGCLGFSGHMSAATACAALGCACGFATLGWLYISRKSFAPRLAQIRATLQQSWSLGKWLFAAQMAIQVQGYITYWLLMGVAGAAITGIYAACMSIVSFANPIMFGLGNVLMPRSVLAWKSGGGAGLRREAIHNALLLAAVLGSFCVFMAATGDSLMHLFYRGAEFEHQGLTVTVLAGALLATGIGMPASNALAAMQRPRAIVCVGLVAAVVTVALVWVLMVNFGLLGAACGCLAGNLVGTLGRWAAFLTLVRSHGAGTRLVRVLNEITGSKAHADATITRLGEGDFATVFLISFGEGRTIVKGCDRLVVKVYKRSAAGGVSFADVQRDADALARLRAALHPSPAGGGIAASPASQSAGWRITAPEPLYVCEASLALVMTAAPGRDIDSSVAGGDQLDAEQLRDAASAFVAAMKLVWAGGERHGDLGLRNVLFDPTSRQISVIDAGTEKSCPACGRRGGDTAATDFSHLLCELATDVADVMGSAVTRPRKQIFVGAALATFAATLASPAAKTEFLAELWQASQAHLAATLCVSCSPRGLWHWLIRWIALHRIRSMLDAISQEPPPADQSNGSSQNDADGQDRHSDSRYLQLSARAESARPKRAGAGGL